MKVLSDAWEMLHDRNCQALQFGLIADPRLHNVVRALAWLDGDELAPTRVSAFQRLYLAA